MASQNDPPEIDGPPIKTNKDLPKRSEPWEDVQPPIDILLLTVKDCEFFTNLSFLSDIFGSYHDKLGMVYFGNIGDERMLLKVALIKCDKGSAGPGGSTVVVKNAVEVLGPRAVFCVGFCAGLNCKKVKLGDVVVSAKLITYAATKVLEDGIQERGVRVPMPQRISKLITHAAAGWVAPLKASEKFEATVHRDGVFLSCPELVDNSERRKELVSRFPEAIAIEMKGEGLFAAAHDVEVPWIIIKGVSDFADGTKTETNQWRSFASVMAASVVANLLNDSIVFKNWRHYGNQYAEPTAATKRKADSESATASAEYTESEPKRPKLTATPAGSNTVKAGNPSEDDLEGLSKKLGDKWQALGRRLGFKPAEITEFDEGNKKLSSKALQMLIAWQDKKGLEATYQVLYDALCHEFVAFKSAAEDVCCG